MIEKLQFAHENGMVKSPDKKPQDVKQAALFRVKL